MQPTDNNTPPPCLFFSEVLLVLLVRLIMQVSVRSQVPGITTHHLV